MNMRATFFSVVAFFIICSLQGQNHVYQTFKSTYIINTRSVETLPDRKLDFRVSHRFGDFAGDNGGWETFYGLEEAKDILIGFDYGISDNLTFGFNRTKGAGPLKRLLNTSLKWKFVHQKDDGSVPISIAAMGLATVSTMKKTEVPDAINSFPKSSHRWMYAAQLYIASKLSDGISLQVIPGYTHRNLVTNEDENGIFSVGFAGRLQVSKVLGLVFDVTYPFSDLRTTDNGYYIPLGVGVELETGGHVFQINFTNAEGIAETDYIPNTRSSWADEQFRLGFTISRWFNL